MPLDLPPAAAEQAIHCSKCEDWNQPQAPFRIHGNTWYVGTRELSAILVTGPKGHVLLDATLPQSVPQILANIRALGFKPTDVKWILNSHAHFDHAGGIAAMQRASGAKVGASASGAAALRAGEIGNDDPQYEGASNVHYPRVQHVQVLADNQDIAVGPLHLRAMMTPGHTPGSTSYTWRSCEGKDCRQIVYADSLTSFSLGKYRYTGGQGRPDVSGKFAASIERIRNAPCDIVLSTHPGATEILERHAASTPAHNAFIDPKGCQVLAEGAADALKQRLQREAKAAPDEEL